MSKYADLSDFEVNKLVAERRHGVIVAENQYLHYPDRDDNVVVVDKNKHSNRTAVDYCNYWADAGPLMVELKKNGLDVIIDDEGVCALSETLTLQSFSDNPCRAIAECYLMMKDEL